MNTAKTTHGRVFISWSIMPQWWLMVYPLRLDYTEKC